MAPGVANSPWTAQPTSAFTGEFLTYLPAGLTYNLFNGAWVVTSWKPFWYTADETCAGDPIELNVFRARNSIR